MKKILATTMLAIGLLASNYIGAEATNVATTPGSYEEPAPVPVQVNTCHEVGTGVYKVTSVATNGYTVEYVAPVNKNSTKAIIPATITLPEDGNIYKVTTIAAGAFMDCKNIRTVRIGGNVLSIGSEAFKNCVKLAKIEIPSNVKTMGAKAFMNCTALKKATIGGNIQTISNYAFCKCTSLQTVVIGSKVKTIGTSAFSGCTKVKSIQINSKYLKTVKKNAFKGIQKKAEIKVPASKVGTYKKLLKSKVPSTATIIKK